MVGNFFKINFLWPNVIYLMHSMSFQARYFKEQDIDGKLNELLSNVLYLCIKQSLYDTVHYLIELKI